MSDVIAIIGGGFSGTVLAVNLLRHSRDARIVLVERTGDVGCGVAYADRSIPYVLNVPAQRLSANSAVPLQFLEFAQGRLPAAGPEDFLPRALYGQYLAEQLAQAQREATGNNRLECVQDEALDVSRAPGGGFSVTLRQHAPLAAGRVVLAFGVPAARPASWAGLIEGHPAFHPDPWHEPPLHLDDRHEVLILGNGLTMADIATSLSWRRTSVPQLHALSRRGVLPQPQTEFDPGVAGGAERLLASAGSARQLLRASRDHAAEVQQAGGDWRQVVTLIRQLAPRIWHGLPLPEQRRFLRHVRVYWESHRHRMPPQIAAQLASLRAAGRLQVHAGRLLRAEPAADRIRVSWLPRGAAAPRQLSVDALINATGPEMRLSHQAEPLVRALRRQDLVAADPLELGLRISGAGECLDGGGQAVPGLYYLGPLLRAEFWEATAVTELRNLAEALARRLCAA